MNSLVRLANIPLPKSGSLSASASKSGRKTLKRRGRPRKFVKGKVTRSTACKSRKIVDCHPPKCSVAKGAARTFCRKAKNTKRRVSAKKSRSK